MVEVRPTNLSEEVSTMTTTTIALTELAEKGADIDVLRQMVQFMAQRLMELDVEARCGAGYDQKSAERINSRNGYRDRLWETRAGSVELRIPKLHQGSTSPSSWSQGAPPRRRSPPSSRRPTSRASPPARWTT
jgi:transposase-like protein